MGNDVLSNGPTAAERTQVLVTGFEPFGGDAINPSWEVAKALDGSRLGDGALIRAALLPCAFDAVQQALEAAIEVHRPRLLIALGLAGSRTELGVERVALNWCDARMADNAGQQPMDQPVVPGAPMAYLSPLPVKAMAQAMREVGAPATVSYTAGTFVCNQVLYLLAHGMQTRWPQLRAGFIHVPGLPGQGGISAPGFAGIPLSLQAKAVRAALEAAWLQTEDVAMVGGTLD